MLLVLISFRTNNRVTGDVTSSLCCSKKCFHILNVRLSSDAALTFFNVYHDFSVFSCGNILWLTVANFSIQRASLKTSFLCLLTLWVEISLQWRHNGCDGVSNHQPHRCLLNSLFSCRSKKTSKLRVTGLCAGNSPVSSPLSCPETWKMFPFDDVIIGNDCQIIIDNSGLSTF